TSPQSADCANNIKSSFEKWNFPFAFTDTSLAFGFSANDVSAIVQAIKDQGVDFITACIDLNGEVNLQKALKAAGVNNVKFWAPQGYDQQNLDRLGAAWKVFTSMGPCVPCERAKGKREMSASRASMKRAGRPPRERARAGGKRGALLGAGIRAAGKNFPRQSVIDAINK